MITRKKTDYIVQHVLTTVVVSDVYVSCKTDNFKTFSNLSGTLKATNKFKWWISDYNDGINGCTARVNMSKHGAVVKFHFKKQGANVEECVLF